MGDEQLDAISGQLEGRKNPGRPPLHLWHPELSGDIDIVIERDGRWIHEGRPIERTPLVRLFASILRREDDGEYYLVTPVEKWRLRVECLPLVVTDFDVEGTGASADLRLTLNTGRELTVDEQHPLFLPEVAGAGDIPAVALEHGLAALFNRASWYRLAELCEEREQGAGVWSAGRFWLIAPAA